MKRINKHLIDNIKYIKGTVLSIGLDDNTSETIRKRDNVQNFYVINHNSKDNNSDDMDNSDNSNFDIRKLHKQFSRKEIDYTICNLDVLDKHLPYFIKDIININDEEVIVYGHNQKYDVNMLLKQLQRYKTKIEVTDCGEYFLIKIITKDIVVSGYLQFIYLVSDLLWSFIDRIGNVLTK